MAEGSNVLLGILAIILCILVLAFPLFSVFTASVIAGFAIIFLGIWLWHRVSEYGEKVKEQV